MKAGIIEEIESPIGVNNVFVPKKTLEAQGRLEIRTAGDFRPINAATIRDSYPLEDMNKIVEWLAKRMVFSSMDMRDGYWGVALRPSDRYLTAVKTSMGLIQFTRMAMGLRNAGPFYQSIIEKTLRKYLWLNALAYQDDVSVATEGEREHVEALRNIFELLWKKNLRMKLSKCSFRVAKMEGLGYEIGYNHILPKNSYRQAMENYRAQTNGS